MVLLRQSARICRSGAKHLELSTHLRICDSFPRRRSHTSNIFQDGPPLRIAIVGSGPAGFYAARKLMSRVDNAVIDMYEQLPVPFGLVRFGVAPDHPEVKNCQDTFTEVAESPNFNFIGNVNLGYELPLSLLKSHYHAILFAYGASKDRELGIEYENDVKQIYSARAFVGWYNGLPEYCDLNPDLTSGEVAVIIGQGNVALDVARTLLTDIGVLRKTDMSEHALSVLSQSRIKHVRIVGRRGPLQAAFTIKEIRELMKLPNTRFEPIPAELFPPDLTALPRPQKRLLQLLSKGSPTSSHASKSWSLDFLLSPRSLHWSPSKPYKLTDVEFTRNTLADPLSPTSRLLPTPEKPECYKIQASALFRSIGYKSEPLPGLEALGILFDKREGIIPNDGIGRVVADMPGVSLDERIATEPVPGMYCTGWVKNGPTGVIATTMNDAFATAEAIAADWADGRNASRFLGGSGRGWEGVEQDAKAKGLQPRRVSWKDWERIDHLERERGREKGKVREKIASVEEMLEVLD